MSGHVCGICSKRIVANSLDLKNWVILRLMLHITVQNIPQVVIATAEIQLENLKVDRVQINNQSSLSFYGLTSDLRKLNVGQNNNNAKTCYMQLIVIYICIYNIYIL